MTSLRACLERLESLRETFGAPAAREKLELLAQLDHKSLRRAADVERLHEASGEMTLRLMLPPK